MVYITVLESIKKLSKYFIHTSITAVKKDLTLSSKKAYNTTKIIFFLTMERNMM